MGIFRGPFALILGGAEWLVLPLALSAFLAHRGARRWAGANAKSFMGGAAIAAAMEAASLFLFWWLIPAIEWVRLNGLVWNGVCPGGPPDISAYLCNALEHQSNALLSPFALAGAVMIAPIAVLGWSATWSVLVFIDTKGTWQKSAIQALGQGAIAGVAAALIFAGGLFVGGSLMARVAFAQTREPEKSIAASEYLEAWGLPLVVGKVGSSHATRLARGPKDVTRETISLRQTDVPRLLAHWQKRCWQPSDRLPEWLFDDRAFEPPSDRAPRMLSGSRAGSSLSAVGIRLSKAGSPIGSGTWASSFEEARRALEAGNIAWEWFAVTVVAVEDRRFVDLEQRGPLDGLRDIKPICESSGTDVDALANRKPVRGHLRGVVETDPDEPVIGRRRRVPGATMVLEHEDGSTRVETTSAVDGSWGLDVLAGRYRVTVRHPEFADYTTGQGWVTVLAGEKDRFFRVTLQPR
jgi:hypothetical protein